MVQKDYQVQLGTQLEVRMGWNVLLMNMMIISFIPHLSMEV